MQEEFCFSLGTISLADFKRITVDRKDCRYLFKALDAEFGTVKEEVSRKTKCKNNTKIAFAGIKSGIFKI